MCFIPDKILKPILDLAIWHGEIPEDEYLPGEAAVLAHGEFASESLGDLVGAWCSRR